MLRNEWRHISVTSDKTERYILLTENNMTRRLDTFSKKNTFVFFIFDVLIVQSDSKPTTFMLVIIKK